MRAYCPANKQHKRFITTAHEVHDWVVDEKGEFLKDLGCIELASKPDRENLWVCKDCGAEAIVE